MPYFHPLKRVMTYKDELCYGCEWAPTECNVIKELDYEEERSPYHEKKITECASFEPIGNPVKENS